MPLLPSVPLPRITRFVPSHETRVVYFVAVIEVSMESLRFSSSVLPLNDQRCVSVAGGTYVNVAV